MFPVQLKVDSVSDAESVLTYSYADYCWFYQAFELLVRCSQRIQTVQRRWCIGPFGLPRSFPRLTTGLQDFRNIRPGPDHLDNGRFLDSLLLLTVLCLLASGYLSHPA